MPPSPKGLVYWVYLSPEIKLCRILLVSVGDMFCDILLAQEEDLLAVQEDLLLAQEEDLLLVQVPMHLGRLSPGGDGAKCGFRTPTGRTTGGEKE